MVQTGRCCSGGERQFQPHCTRLDLRSVLQRLTDQFVVHSEPHKTKKQTLTCFGWITLASRCIDAGAAVLSPKGREFTENSIGATLATRNLMADLRSAGTITGETAPFNPSDRSANLSTLEALVLRLNRRY